MIFRPIINLFSRYADHCEKKADQLFKRIIFLDRTTAQKRLLDLMQYNLVVVNVWLEKEFKAYKYLKKRNRRHLYKNTQLIVQNFEQFCAQFQPDQTYLQEIVKKFNLQFSVELLQKLGYLAQIMAFLKPGQVYEYLESASFGKLLVDPHKEKMIGDCNQIVTFYVFLYSLKFPISDLNIKIIPGHVCLHFNGIDIEATNATFHQYETFEYLLSITELIATNLLDISDVRDAQNSITTRTLLKGSELAYCISSMRPLVEKNLQIAYQNLAIESARKKDFDTARFFLEKLQIPDLKKQIFHNAIIYYCDQHNFQKAKFYVSKLSELDMAKGDEMKRYVSEQEGHYYFKNGNLEHALSIFKSLNHSAMIKACYAQEFNKLQRRVAFVKTIEEAKKQKNTYARMLNLAQLMEDNDATEKIRKILHSF